MPATATSSGASQHRRSLGHQVEGLGTGTTRPCAPSLRVAAGCHHAFDERVVQLVKVLQCTLFLSTDTGVDDDAPPFGFDDVGLECLANEAIGVCVMRLEPRERLDVFGGQADENQVRRELDGLFKDARDGRGAYAPRLGFIRHIGRGNPMGSGAGSRGAIRRRFVTSTREYNPVFKRPSSKFYAATHGMPLRVLPSQLKSGAERYLRPR